MTEILVENQGGMVAVCWWALNWFLRQLSRFQSSSRNAVDALAQRRNVGPAEQQEIAFEIHGIISL